MYSFSMLNMVVGKPTPRF